MTVRCDFPEVRVGKRFESKLIARRRNSALSLVDPKRCIAGWTGAR